VFGSLSHVRKRRVPTPPRGSNSPKQSLIEQRPGELTPRRREILEFVSKGLTNEEIANILSLSPGTVRIQLSSLLSDLQVANRTEATAVFLAWKSRAEAVAEVLARPAITVLPFVALSDAPDAQRSAIAITEDITALFARWCWFPVVRSGPAHPSTVDSSHKFSANPSARFVVSGSIRTSESQWRVTVRLDDTTDDRVLWTERYDLAPSDLFRVQDEFCQQIVSTAYDVLIRGITARFAPARFPESIDA